MQTALQPRIAIRFSISVPEVRRLTRSVPVAVFAVLYRSIYIEYDEIPDEGTTVAAVEPDMRIAAFRAGARMCDGG